MKKLKCGKQDGYLGHYTDHLIPGTHNLTVMLSLLFSSMLTHRYTLDAILVSTNSEGSKKKPQ